ncbi:soluble NSF attachment family protein [Candidatus Kaiserbacteria bacterium]|nr:soluble NSF attachment family protein [Candidatus Kaiserbacteria bacterium]
MNPIYKYTFIFLALFVVASLAAGSIFYYNSIPRHKVETYSTPHTVASVLVQQNRDFSIAETYRNQKEYQKALEYYQKALLTSQDVSQEAQIKFDIALMTELLDNYTDAIQMYKQIAANPGYYAEVRAYAVQEIAIMSNNFYDAVHEIRAETFKDQPYASFLHDDDYTAAYAKLFEYAVSIYPLALSESYIAYGYAKKIAALNAATTTPEGEENVLHITQALQAAQSDVSRMQQTPREASVLPAVFSREAQVVAYMAKVGVPGYTLSQAEDLYNRALAGNAVLGVQPGSFQAYTYALFLAQNYPTRLGDLKNILSIFSTQNSQDIAPDVEIFYKTIRTDKTQASNKKDTALLGRLDPAFKAYLISLGWRESDFASDTTS